MPFTFIAKFRMKNIIILLLAALSSCAGSGTMARYSEPEIESVNIEQSEIARLSGSQIPRIDLRPAIGKGEIVQSELVDSICFVPLETTRGSIFGGISKIVCSGDRILIKDDDGNLRYETTDEQLKKIANTNNPINIQMFAVY